MSTIDSTEDQTYLGVPLETWERAFAPSIIEFTATNCVFSREDQDLMRIAFGNHGPFTGSSGERSSPRFTHAVTLPPNLAIELAQLILKNYAMPGPSD